MKIYIESKNFRIQDSEDFVYDSIALYLHIIMKREMVEIRDR